MNKRKETEEEKDIKICFICDSPVDKCIEHKEEYRFCHVCGKRIDQCKEHEEIRNRVKKYKKQNSVEKEEQEKKEKLMRRQEIKKEIKKMFKKEKPTKEDDIVAKGIMYDKWTLEDVKREYPNYLSTSKKTRKVEEWIKYCRENQDKNK